MGYDELGNRVSKTVAALSHPLQISSIPNQDTALNTPVINIDFTVSSTGTSVDNLTLFGSSSNQTLVPDANIVFGGSGENRTLTATPADDQHGSTTITITVSDGSSSAEESFILTVLSPENNTPTVFGDSYEVNQGQTLTISAPGVLENDTDPENDTLTAQLVSYDGGGDLTLNADGSFTYNHDGSSSTTDSFTYKAHDGQQYSGVAAVTITVNAATTGSISPSPISHDFGAVEIGQRKEKNFTLTNTSLANVAINDLALVGDDSSEFSLENDNCSGNAIPSNGSCTFQVAFHPTVQDQETVTVSIDSSDSQSPQYLLSISGTGVEEASPPPEGVAVLSMRVFKDLLMEGDRTTVSIWFDQVSDSDRNVDLSSIPTESYDLEFPEQIVVPAGTQKMDFSVRADHNYDNESDRTVILKAEGENGTAAQEEIKILDDDSLQNNDGVLQFVAGGLDNDTDGDGVFEAGEDAEYEVWFQRTGSDSPQSSISFSILNDPRNNLRLLDEDCYISAMPTDFEPNLMMTSCSVSLRSSDDIADGDYYILIEWNAGGANASTLKEIRVKNETLPDFTVYGKTLTPSLTPGDTFTWELIPEQKGENIGSDLPELIVYRQKEKETPDTIYRTFADVLEYSDAAPFDYEIEAPSEAGQYYFWAEINPDNGDRIAESDFDNNVSNTLTLTVTLDEAPTGDVQVLNLTDNIWPLGETKTISWNANSPSGITRIPYIRLHYNDSYNTIANNVDPNLNSWDRNLYSNPSYISDNAYIEIEVCSGIKCSQFQSDVFEIADQSEDPSPPWSAPLSLDVNNQPTDVDRFVWAAFENSDGSQELIYMEAEKYPLHNMRLVYGKLQNGTWQNTRNITPDFDYYNSNISDLQALKDQNGDIHVIYINVLDDNRNANEVHYRHLSNGSLVASRQISNNNYEARIAFMALSETGQVFITWREYDRNTSTNMGTYFREGDGLNSWGAETLLKPGRKYPYGIAANNGEPYILFMDNDDGGIYKTVYRSGGVWAEPVAIMDYENISFIKLFQKRTPPISMNFFM